MLVKSCCTKATTRIPSDAFGVFLTDIFRGTMEPELYENIVSFINAFTGTDRQCVKVLKERHPSIESHVLWGIKSLVSQNNTTRKFYKVKGNITNIYNKCIRILENRSEPGVLLGTAIQYGIQPSMMAKIILSHHFSTDSSEKSVNSSINDTSLITHKYLAHEVFLCNVADCIYSPTIAQVRNLIGKEHEIRLENCLSEKGVTFKTETTLREKGYDKTPDILLDMPIAADNFVIHWIESKALFADDKSHRQYANNQYLSYFNRFGTGLVIYWCGYVKSIIEIDEYKNKFLVKQEFPEIVPFNPDLIPI